MKKFLVTIVYCLKISFEASKLYTILRLLGRIVPPMIGIFSAYIVKRIIDMLSYESGSDEVRMQVVMLILFSAFLAILVAVMRRFTNYSESLHSDALTNMINISVMEKSLAADIEMYDNPSYYDKLQAVRRDSYAISNALWYTLDCISSVIIFLSSFVILSRTNYWYGILMILAVIPSAVAGQKYTKMLYSLSLSQINEERQKNYIADLASNKNYAQDIRLFRIGDMLKKRYHNIWQQMYSVKKAKLKKHLVPIMFFSFLPECIVFYATIDISMRVFSSSSTIGDYSFVTALLTQLAASIILVINSGMLLYENKLKIDNVKSFDDIPKNIKDVGTNTLDNIESIEFRDVSFSYPGTEKKVLSDISFRICDKERLCIVGVNGSGKTTLIKLLLRFYEVDSGEIFINNKPINKYSLKSLRKAFSCYFQSAANYGFTLRENISISDIDKKCDDAMVVKALNQSDGISVLNKLNTGLDTYISRMFEDDGVELSGGQNQKLAIARTFYRDSSALILDEPSSSLDPEAEDTLFKNLEELCKGKIAIFTSHRLSNVSMASKIIVIEQGKVIEYGTRNELLELSGRFAELFNYQAEKYNVAEHTDA